MADSPVPAAYRRRTGPRGSSKTRIGAANIDRILDAALAAFARDGLRGTRIGDVAEGAGMSKTNLLYYFSSKEELYRAVLKRTLDTWLAPLRALDASQPARAALRAYIAQKLVQSRSFPEASRLFAIEVMQGATHLRSVLAGDLATLFETRSGIIRQWIERGELAPIEPAHLLFSIWATTQHYADFSEQVLALTGKSLEDEAFFAETLAALTTIILDGVAPRPPRPEPEPT